MVDLEHLPEAVCVVVSWVRFIGVAQRSYEVCTSPRDNDCKEVPPKVAKAIIRERGLVKVQENRDGCVYDTPDRDLYQKYKGWYRIHK